MYASFGQIKLVLCLHPTSQRDNESYFRVRIKHRFLIKRELISRLLNRARFFRRS